MGFEDRLKKAIARGERRRDIRLQEAQNQAISEAELKRLHSGYRLHLSEHIETCIQQLPNHFPGFKYETIYGARGWGAACSRNDLRIVAGRRNSVYSRLELTVRPFSNLHVVELMAKGTIANREVFERDHFEEIEDVDITQFCRAHRHLGAGVCRALRRQELSDQQRLRRDRGAVGASLRWISCLASTTP